MHVSITSLEEYQHDYVASRTRSAEIGEARSKELGNQEEEHRLAVRVLR